MHQYINDRTNAEKLLVREGGGMEHGRENDGVAFRTGKTNGTAWTLRCGKINENRQFELCSYHRFANRNTFFQNKPRHKVSKQHLRSNHCHQLGLFYTRRDTFNNVKNTIVWTTALTTSWFKGQTWNPSGFTIPSRKDVHVSILVILAIQRRIATFLAQPKVPL